MINDWQYNPPSKQISAGFPHVLILFASYAGSTISGRTLRMFRMDQRIARLAGWALQTHLCLTFPDSESRASFTILMKLMQSNSQNWWNNGRNPPYSIFENI